MASHEYIKGLVATNMGERNIKCDVLLHGLAIMIETVDNSTISQLLHSTTILGILSYLALIGNVIVE
jgi:hypothetical protein